MSNNDLSIADGLKTEGMSLFQRGLRDEALAKFEAAAEAYVQAEDASGEGEMLNNLGVVYRISRRHDEAIAALQKATALFASLGDKNREGQAWGNLADVYMHSDKGAAAEAYATAVPLLAESGDSAKQSEVLRALSLLHLRQGKWAQAMLHMESSLRAKPRRSFGDTLLYGLLRFVSRLMGGSTI